MRKKLMLVLLVASLLVLPAVGCAKPLTINMTSHMTSVGSSNKSQVEVKGIVSDSKAVVWVNGSIVPVTKTQIGSKGNFSAQVTLNEGENTISIVAARDKKGVWVGVVSRTITIRYIP